jgi:hypothetical protein
VRVAHRNIVLSDGWNATDFLRTVNPSDIRREVRAAFGMTGPTAPSSVASRTPDVGRTSQTSALGSPNR